MQTLEPEQLKRSISMSMQPTKSEGEDELGCWAQRYLLGVLLFIDFGRSEAAVAAANRVTWGLRRLESKAVSLAGLKSTM